VIYKSLCFICLLVSLKVKGAIFQNIKYTGIFIFLLLLLYHWLQISLITENSTELFPYVALYICDLVYVNDDLLFKAIFF